MVNKCVIPFRKISLYWYCFYTCICNVFIHVWFCIFNYKLLTLESFDSSTLHHGVYMGWYLCGIMLPRVIPGQVQVLHLYCSPPQVCAWQSSWGGGRTRPRSATVWDFPCGPAATWRRPSTRYCMCMAAGKPGWKSAVGTHWRPPVLTVPYNILMATSGL